MTHAELVQALKKSPQHIDNEITHLDLDIIHMGIGISGEAGELLDAIKKKAIYQKELDRENIIEELGDLEFYMEGLRQAIGITREETIEHNIAKLTKRYGKQYSNEAAHARADKN